MAGETRQPAFDLKEEMLQEGKSFAFFQALRLLRLLAGPQSAADHDPIRDAVRIRPLLSLAHPPTEIDAIDDLPPGGPQFRITATFLGLYGESSPLPSFFTEDLMEDDSEGGGVNRPFVDLINYPLYLLFYEAWTRHRPYIKVVDEKDQKYFDILFSLAGLGVEGLPEGVPNSYQLLRYIGLLSMNPKSAMGLRQILADALDEPNLEIVPCIPRKVIIPEDQRCFLGRSGNVLGLESYLGETMIDMTRKYRIKVAPIDGNRYRQLLPGTFKFRRMMFLSKFYLMDDYESDLELGLGPGDVDDARLGDARWSRLGYDTWLLAGKDRPPVGAVFELK